MATFSWKLDCEGFIHHKMEAHHTEFFSQAPVSNVAATLATHLVRKGEMDAAIGGGGGATTLDQLTDVTLSPTVDDGSLLIYDADAGEWVDGYAAVKAPVHNDTASQIDKGTPVYIASTHTSGKPTVEPADNNGAGTHPAIGLAYEDIPAGTEGRVLVSGMLHGVDTTAYSAGDALYLDSTPGALTATRPSLSADQVQKVGIVTRVNASAGDILVIGAGRVNDVNNELITLTGVARQADDLGTFTGTTISDANTIKGALQELETDVEGRASIAGNNAFTGTNTFNSSLPTSSVTPTAANQLITKTYSDSQDLVVLASAATKAGTNAFTGTNTFNVNLPTSTVTPSNATDLTTKTYVDTEIAAIGGLSDGDKGDITVSGSGSTWTIDTGVVSNSKMASMADDTIKGNVSGASAAPSDLTAAQVRTMINVEDGATADQTNAEIETAYNAQVAQVSGAEITAGTATGIRRYSPADIVNFVSTHETTAPVDSVNTQTGAVVLDADDIDDTSTAHKFVAAADITKLGFISVTQAVDLDTMESDITGKADTGGANTFTDTQTIQKDSTTADTLILESSEDSSDAAPILTLNRNSASPADGDYLGQIKFKGDSDTGVERTYAKITGKTSDVSNGAEDGLIEFMCKENGSNTIVARLTHNAFKLINSTSLEVDGDITVTGNVDGRDVAADGTKLDFLTVTQAVDLDTLESDVATNNAKVGVTDGDKGDIVVATSGTQWTIDSGAVTNAKLEDVDNNTIKGNVSGGISSPSDLNATQVRTMINVEDGATADQTDAEIETAYNAQVDQVTGAEITAGTDTTVHRYSPADIASFVDQHEEVKLAANNAFTGTNTFNTALPTSSITPTAGPQLITKTYSDSQDLFILGLSATKNGTNAFVGTNTFNNSLPTSTVTPSSDTDLTTKVYVDDQIDTTVLAPVSLRGTGGSPYSTQTTTTLTEQFSFDIPANTLTTRTMHLRIMGTFTTPVANTISVFSFKIGGTQYHGSQSTITTSIERPFVLELDLASMGSSTLFMVGSSRLSGSGIASGTGQPRGNAFALGGDGAFGNYDISEDATTTLTFSMDQRWTDVTNSPVFKLFAVTAEYV